MRGWHLDLDALERAGAEPHARVIVFNATSMPAGGVKPVEPGIGDGGGRRGGVAFQQGYKTTEQGQGGK